MITRFLINGACTILISLLVVGCDLQNPVLITEDEADPRLLVNGALIAWNNAIGSAVTGEFLASDEASYSASTGTLAAIDSTGDLSLDLGYQYQFTVMSEARELTRAAILRARDLKDDAALYRALTYHGWFLLETARRWGKQPITGDGVFLEEEEIYQRAIEHFNEVEQASGPEADSMSLRAIAGIAWAEWVLGRDNADRARLERAITMAQRVLDEAPEFTFTIPGQFNTFAWPVSSGSYIPEPHFEHIPFWWEDPMQPDGTQYSNANGLRLIQADAQLRLQDLEVARSTVKSIPLLKNNHVGLAGRDPEGAPLTDEEVNNFIDPLDADGLQFVIDELYRENWYTHGRRNVGPHGPIFPVDLPAAAY